MSGDTGEGYLIWTTRFGQSQGRDPKDLGGYQRLAGGPQGNGHLYAISISFGSCQVPGEAIIGF